MINYFSSGTPIKKVKRYIDYEEVIRKERHIKNLKAKGFIIIPKRNFKFVGWVLIGLGILTIPIPFTTIFFVSIGLFLLGISKQEFFDKLIRKFKLLRYKLRSKNIW